MIDPTLAADLVAALKELATIDKGNTAKIRTKAGDEYTYTFTDLADVVKVTRKTLGEHNIVALSPIHGHGDDLAVTIELVHSSGAEKRFDPLPFPSGNDAQATGSAITYHRRYALLAALGIAPVDEDDDGAKASEQPTQRRSQSPKASTSATGPSEAQERFIAKLVGGNTTAVANLAAQIMGEPTELEAMPRAKVSDLIDALKEWASEAKAQDKTDRVTHEARKTDASEQAANGEEPW